MQQALALESVELWIPIRPAPSEVSPLPALTLLFSVGIGCGLAWPQAAVMAWPWVAAALAALWLVAWVARRSPSPDSPSPHDPYSPHDPHSPPNQAITLAASLAAALGIFTCGWAAGGTAYTAQTPPPSWADGEGLIAFEVDGYVQRATEGRRAVRIRALGAVSLRDDGTWHLSTSPLSGAHLWWDIPPDEPPLGHGERRIGRIRWYQPAPLLTPGQPHPHARLRARNVQGFARSLAPTTRAHGPPSLLGWLSLRRQDASAALRASPQTSTNTPDAPDDIPHDIPPDSLGVVEAVTLGEGGAIPDTVRASFSATGLSHVLAVSGLHFSVIAWAVWTALGALLRRWRWGVRRWGAEPLTALATLPALIAYVAFVGAPISALRALLMVACALSAKTLHREGHGVLGLCAAALTLLAFDPLSLLNIGFQLSFAAVLGILWGAHTWERALRALPIFNPLHPLSPLSPLSPLNLNNPNRRRWLRPLVAAARWLGSMAAVTAAASVATTPLVLWHFGQAPLLGLLANLWVVPWVSFVLLPLGALSVTLWLLLPAALHPALCAPVIAAARWAEAAMLWSVDAAAALLPWVSLSAPALPPWLLLTLAALSLMTLWLAMHTWAKPAAAALALTAALGVAALLWHPNTNHDPDDPHTLRVTFLSVGQGDATLIEAPNGTSWLIDAGGARHWDPGARVVVPALYALGLRRLDHLIVTHPDLDHFGGIPPVLLAFRPHHLWTSGLDDPDPAYQAMLSTARSVGAQVLPLTHAHPPFDLGPNASLEVLWPHLPDPSRGKNDNSVVLMLRHNTLSFLLPGDLEAPGEAALLASDAPLRATVLKAGHHGSQTSSTPAFLEAVNPQVVVYSVGADNAFGLPHPDVLSRFDHLGVTPYRTDLHGSIRMTSDGHRLLIDRWQP